MNTQENKFIHFLKLKLKDPDTLFILIVFVSSLFYLGIPQTILLSLALSIGALCYASFVTILIGVFKYKLGIKALYTDIIYFSLSLGIIILFAKYHQDIAILFKAIINQLTSY